MKRNIRNDDNGHGGNYTRRPGTIGHIDKKLDNPKHIKINNELFEIVSDDYTNKNIGEKIAHGFGLMDMMDYCYEHKLSNENSILVKEVPPETLSFGIQEEWFLFTVK